jgi:molecular chaperone GrpE
MTNGHDQDNTMHPSQDPADNNPTGAGSDDIAREAAQIAALHAEIAELKDRYLRAVADTENLRKRAEREKQDAAQFAFARFARDLLSVVDNFERALDVMKPEKRAALSGETLSVIEGIEATQRQLLAVFERFAIRKIDAIGKKFNPNFHEAIAEVPSPAHAPGAVIAVAENGYVIGERLLRAAKVAIASQDSQPDPSSGGVDTTA